MLKRLAVIISGVVEIDADSILLEHDLVNDLGLSSLDVVNLTVLFEKEFNISIPNRQISKFVTVNDIACYLQENAAVKGAV